MTIKEIKKILRQSAKKDFCFRTGKQSWSIGVNGFHFVVVKGAFRGPGVDISDVSLKKTRKELINCILQTYSSEEIKEMISM